MIYLNKKDIDSLVDFNQLIDSIEKASLIYEKNKYTMPNRINIKDKDDTYIYMPCFTDNIKGTKILTIYPENKDIKEDIIQGLMLLNNSKTGKIDCILDGATMSAYRTGAVGACGIKHTTREDVSSLGIIGSGVQGFYQCIFAINVRNFQEIFVYDISTESAHNLKDRLLDFGITQNITICNSTKDVVRYSDVIVTATTSKTPVVPKEPSLLKNKHFIGIGSYTPEMREFPDELFPLLNEVFLDVDFAKEESGDLRDPIEKGLLKTNNIYSLGSILNGKKVERYQTTLYKSVGMALFDIIVANLLFENAKVKNIGQNIIL